jgi:hypothetical protein
MAPFDSNLFEKVLESDKKVSALVLEEWHGSAVCDELLLLLLLDFCEHLVIISAPQNGKITVFSCNNSSITFSLSRGQGVAAKRLTRFELCYCSEHRLSNVLSELAFYLGQIKSIYTAFLSLIVHTVFFQQAIACNGYLLYG